MKKRTISFLCGLLVAACSPELYDENSVLENNRQQAEMSVEVQVSGTMVSTRTVASDDERAVTSYDIYIFDVTANALQYYKQGIVPHGTRKNRRTHNYRHRQRPDRTSDLRTEACLRAGQCRQQRHASATRHARRSDRKYSGHGARRLPQRCRRDPPGCQDPGSPLRHGRH